MAPQRTWIASYGCTSSAGSRTGDFWSALCAGADQSSDVSTEGWPVQASGRLRACLFAEPAPTARATLGAQLLRSWAQARPALPAHAKLGVIFASTKGFIEDYVWSKLPPHEQPDPYAGVLSDFVAASGIEARRTICVSNACASSLAALYLARLWLAQGELTHVLVLAADRVGPFVLKGFQSLRALTPDRVRSFDRGRDGLRLGEASAAILLTSQPGSRLELEGVGLDTEGFAATRPASSGTSLERACLQLRELRERPPQVVVAHGTGTPVNDSAEDQVLSRLFEDPARAPFVTGTKWCIGHTLGASAAMDVIAACRVLETQTFFHLANTREIDPAFRARYLSARAEGSNTSIAGHELKRALVTSLGFGGVHAAASLAFVETGS